MILGKHDEYGSALEVLDERIPFVWVGKWGPQIGGHWHGSPVSGWLLADGDELSPRHSHSPGTSDQLMEHLRVLWLKEF